jgi:3-oxoacyl-[acyl-carrier protein] reductase
VTGGLTGRTAVVTGTAHGIGAAIAQALADSGATVHGVDKDVADLTSPDAVREFFAATGQQALVQGIAMRRLGTPADIANGVRFFVAERSSWVTGQTISIDGGHALL